MPGEAKIEADRRLSDFLPGNPELTRKEAFYNAFALFAVGVSVAAMVVEGSLLVNAVGMACTVLGPAAAFKQNKLAEIESLRKVQNQLTARVKELENQNKKLAKANERLEETVSRLSEAERALEEIGKVQGKSLDLLVEQVNEYKKIQADMKQNLQASIIQNLLSTIVNCDTDGDFQIDPEEVPRLILKLRNLNGVEFSESNFRKALDKSGYSLKAVLEITKNLLDDKIPDEDNIFLVK